MRTIKEIIKLYGGHKAFQEKFKVPARTSENWVYRDCCPDWYLYLINKFTDMMIGGGDDDKKGCKDFFDSS